MYFPKMGSEDQTSAECALTERFETHIRDKAFPCVGAKSALARQQMQFMVAGDIRCPRDDRAIYEGLRDFARAYKARPELFQSFVVLFQTAEVLSEPEFEQVMFRRLQALEAYDAAAGEAYDPRVSPEPSDPEFSLSFGGEAFFAVALHPGASRPARRFEVPALVFNAHAQFEILRAEGRYETLRGNIIDRDIALSGTPNPMLARHGETSEARQYSGRKVEADWRCPLRQVHQGPSPLNPESL